MKISFKKTTAVILIILMLVMTIPAFNSMQVYAAVTGDDAAELAVKLANGSKIPYVHGGKTPEGGFDCSGFTSYVYKQLGITIPAGTEGQKSAGAEIDNSKLKATGDVSMLQPGDLILFDINNKGTPGHVGMYVGDGMMVHASVSKNDIIQVSLTSSSGKRPWYSVVYNVRRIINTSVECEHNYIIEYEEAHPHKEYKQCTKCNHIEYTGKSGTSSSCIACNKNNSSTTSVPKGYKAITTAKELNAIRNDLNGKYILMKDIDLSSYKEWKPIGGNLPEEQFSGVFDGNGHAIRNMKITNSSVYKGSHGYQYAGLFSSIKGATVKNIREITGKITSTSNKCLYAGGIAGKAEDSEIRNCLSKVTISYKNGTPDGTGYTFASGIAFDGGGIIGFLSGNSKIEQCGNKGAVTGVGNGVPMHIGGITGTIGAFSDGVKIENCFNHAKLSAKTGFVSAQVGGIIGWHFSASQNSNIKNCYNTGKLSCIVTENKEKPHLTAAEIGGIAGQIADAKAENFRIHIANCYYESGAVSAVGNTLKYVTVGARPFSLSAMDKKDSYKGFDFGTVWKIDSSISSYPVFTWTEKEEIVKQETSSTPSVNKITKSSKGTLVQIKKATGVKYYELYYATKKNGPYKMVKCFSDNTKNSTRTILHSVGVKGKTYYYKVRGYVYKDGKKAYSKFSAPKSIKY